jgi:predicted ATPase/DNA-binding SARP family transcriptional activator/DNA-binding CsgD family transcriptional regulator
MYSWGNVRAKHRRQSTSENEVPQVLSVELLGGFQVLVGCRGIKESKWRLKKAAGLVKLLALAPGHRLHRERVVNLLWPDLDPKAAANNLRYALHNARRTLESTPGTASYYLNSQDGLLVLCPMGECWTDVEIFEEAADAARSIRDPAAYERAVKLYSGDLLPEDRYEPWAESRREELRRTYNGLLLELAMLQEERGDFGSAIEALQRVLAGEPVHEETYLNLMRLYANSGQRQEALRQYAKLREILWRELRAEPSARSSQLYEDILVGRYPSADPLIVGSAPKDPAGARRYNVPAARTSFVGRQRELVEVKRALATTRLLTLTGTCGSGKTTLALEVARESVGAYPGGVWLTELAPLSEEMLVPQAVARALRVREEPHRPLIASLMDALRKEKMLVVLDNCEHLIESVAHLVDSLLSSCPQLRILATSREVLGVTGEVRWRVPPLSLPDPQSPTTVENVVTCESVQLFIEQARCYDPSFVLTPQNVEVIAQMCRQLEGIPLALELAAARVGVLSVEQIAASLSDSLDMLTATNRTVSPRHQTMRRALDWSYALLSKTERRVFNRLSVFAGSWTLEAAKAVVTGSGIVADDILKLLSQLIDKSLIAVEGSAEGIRRYRMLQPLRQYGQMVLEASGEASVTRYQHALYFLGLAEVAESELKGTRQQEWLNQLERACADLRMALSWVLEQGDVELGLRLSSALGEYWNLRGDLGEGCQWLEAALNTKGRIPRGPTLSKTLTCIGRMAWEQGEYERSAALSEESLILSRELANVAGMADALSTMAWASLQQNELGRASKLAEEARTYYRALGDTAGFARTLLISGMAAAVQRDHGRAAALHKESLKLGQKLGDNFTLILSLALGAWTFLGLNDHGRARDLCAEGLELSRKLQMGHLAATHLHIAAALACVQGKPARAARLWGAAKTLRDARKGASLSPVERYLYDPYIAAARAQLDKVAWEGEWTEGLTMTLAEAVEYALYFGEKSQTATRSSEKLSDGARATGFTCREREVAALVARGLTNSQIAAELVISEHTAAAHVRKILKKSGLSSRVQIATLVAEQVLPLAARD